VQPSPEFDQPLPPGDRRAQARYKLVLRAGIIEQEGRSSFCLLKNISSRGVQLKTYAQPLVGSRALLRIADMAPVSGRLIWATNGVAGLRFDTDLDATALLRVKRRISDNGRRAVPRMTIDGSASVRACGKIFAATVCDISSLGARLRCRSPMVPGERAMIEFRNLPPIEAYVRWADGAEVGIAFQTAIPMKIISHWISACTRVIA